MVVTIKISSFSVIALEKAFNNFKNLLNLETPLLINNNVFSLSNLKLVRLPNKKNVITILKSPHVDKKARSQLGTISHHRLIVLNLAEYNDNSNKDIKNLNELLYNFKNLSVKTKYKINI